MSNSQEFIYKCYSEGFGNESAVHILRKLGENKPYYLLQLDTELEVGQRVEINYRHTVPYRNGQLLVGGACL